MLLTVNDDILHEALIRVPLGAHGALCLTCRKFCEIVRSERYGKMRRDLGWIDYGVFVFGGINESHGDPKNGCSRMEDPEENFYCLTHKFDEPCDTAFALVRSTQQPEIFFTDALNLHLNVAASKAGLMVVSGDPQDGGEIEDMPPFDVLVYDAWTRRWLEADSPGRTLPAHLPLKLMGHCTAFVNGQLIIAGGYRVDTEDESRDYSFTWDEASRQWDSLPSMPHPASHSAHAVIGSCLYIIGGDEPWDGI